MMLLLIILTMVATVLWWGTPTIRALEIETQYSSTKGYFENLNREVKILMRDGWGCSREYKISIPSGGLRMYKDSQPFIEEEEIRKEGEIKPKTVWGLSYNLPSSKYDLLFEGVTDESVDNFRVRRIDSPTPLAAGGITVECLEGERKGEIQRSGAMSITASGTTVKLNLYDVSRISVNVSNEIVAEAYVFNLASIAYRYPTDKGTFHLIQQNTGLSTNYPEEGSMVLPLLMSESSLSGSKNSLTLFMTDFSPRGIYQTGSGDYSLRMRFSDVGYYGNIDVKDLRMTMDGDYKDAWISSLTEKFKRAHVSSNKFTGFVKDDAQEEKGVIYNTPSSYFAEHQNLLMFNVVWAGVDVEIGG
jgi:hypothetical protein